MRKMATNKVTQRKTQLMCPSVQDAACGTALKLTQHLRLERPMTRRSSPLRQHSWAHHRGTNCSRTAQTHTHTVTWRKMLSKTELPTPYTGSGLGREKGALKQKKRGGVFQVKPTASCQQHECSPHNSCCPQASHQPRTNCCHSSPCKNNNNNNNNNNNEKPQLRPQDVPRDRDCQTVRVAVLIINKNRAP